MFLIDVILYNIFNAFCKRFVKEQPQEKTTEDWVIFDDLNRGGRLRNSQQDNKNYDSTLHEYYDEEGPAEW